MELPESEIKQFELLDLEIRDGKKIDVYGEAIFTPSLCECTSTAGNQEVTERWLEWELEEVELESIHYWADGGTKLVHLPLKCITDSDIMLIMDLIPEYES
tara:strand:+ start:1451 stop:1753 length:303 start_codon:yes stop_codon:yes gene_type:complete